MTADAAVHQPAHHAYEAMEGRRPPFTITAGRVRLEDGSEGREAVRVEVTDDGPGIPQDVAAKVFDPSSPPSRRLRPRPPSSARSSMRTRAGIDLLDAAGTGNPIRVTLPVSSETTAVPNDECRN